MTDLPFDPVKALDLQPGFKAPESAHRDYTFLPVPSRVFSTGRSVSSALYAIVFVDGFSRAHGFPMAGVTETQWLKFLALCALSGLDQPCALTSKHACWIRCAELFRSGYDTLEDHPRRSEYLEKVRTACGLGG